MHYADPVDYPEGMKNNKIGLLALKREAISMKLYRLCFIAILLNGSTTHAWETQRQPHNTHYLKLKFNYILIKRNAIYYSTT